MNVNIKNFNLSCGDSHTIISTDDNIYSFGRYNYYFFFTVN